MPSHVLEKKNKCLWRIRRDKKIKVLTIHMLRTSLSTYQGVQYQCIIWCTPSFRLVHWKHKYSTIWFMTWSPMSLDFQNGFKVYFFQTPAGYVYQVIHTNVRIFNWFTLSLILDVFFFKRWLSLDIPGPLTFFLKIDIFIYATESKLSVSKFQWII